MRAKQKFKLSATIIGICFLLHGIPVFAAESSEMIEFDLKTNEMKTVEIEEQNSDSVDSYIPEGISTGIQTYGAIIDGDDRYRIPANLSSTTFPYCSYGVVSCTWPDGASSFGTGWLFGPNDVATAAHVVYSHENGGYPSSIIFYPGVNKSGSIVGASYEATIAVLPATYQSERDDTKDYAFLSLNSNIGNTLGYLGWTTSVSVGNTMALTGYAGEHPYELWEGIGQIKSTSGSFLRYTADSSRGMSGGAIYLTIPMKAAGFNHGGYPGESYNYGVKINSSIANEMNYYKNKN